MCVPIDICHVTRQHQGPTARLQNAAQIAGSGLCCRLSTMEGLETYPDEGLAALQVRTRLRRQWSINMGRTRCSDDDAPGGRVTEPAGEPGALWPQSCVGAVLGTPRWGRGGCRRLLCRGHHASHSALVGRCGAVRGQPRMHRCAAAGPCRRCTPESPSAHCLFAYSSAYTGNMVMSGQSQQRRSTLTNCCVRCGMS